MDLIERAKVERITFQEPSYSDPINVLTEVRDKVRALPTVDAAPIVRCKNCINRYSICPMITIDSSGAIRTITYRAQDDWWCCFGKRKEE